MSFKDDSVPEGRYVAPQPTRKKPTHISERATYESGADIRDRVLAGIDWRNKAVKHHL